MGRSIGAHLKLVEKLLIFLESFLRISRFTSKINLTYAFTLAVAKHFSAKGNSGIIKAFMTLPNKFV